MSSLQSAQVSVADFGAPNVSAPVLVFQARSGGNVSLTFENPVANTDLTVAVQVSVDNVTYAATTAPNNLEAVTAVVVAPRVRKDFTINLRAGIDNYFRVVASGGVRGVMQYRGDNAQIEQIIR